MTSLTLNIKVDFPPFNGSVTVKGDATMAAFVEAACKESKMEKSVLQRYNMVAASYKADVIELSHQAKTIEGLQTGYTVFFAAPGDLKPAVSLRKKKKAKDEEDKDLTDDKFAGLTPGGVISKLIGQVTPKQQKLYIEYIGENFEDMNRQSLLKLPQDKMLALLSSDTLGVETEGVAFTLAMDWAKAKLKTEGKTASPDTVKTAVAPLLPAIRFPCMNSTDMASLVMPAGILDSQVILDLFTHIGKTAERKNDDEKPPKLEGSLKGMNGKPRSGGTGGIANFLGDFRTNSSTSYFEGKRWIIYINKKKAPTVYTDYLPWSSVYTTMHGITGYRITNGKVEKDMITLNDGGCDYTLRFDKTQSKGKDVVLAGTWFSTQGNGSGTMTLRRTDKKIPESHKQFLGVEK